MFTGFFFTLLLEFHDFDVYLLFKNMPVVLCTATEVIFFYYGKGKIGKNIHMQIGDFLPFNLELPDGFQTAKTFLNQMEKCISTLTVIEKLAPDMKFNKI